MRLPAPAKGRKEEGAECLSVLDDGPGIAPEAMAHLFEPFHSTKERGTGLGLSTVKKIAEGHGGTIFAHNREGGGATFRIELPPWQPS